MNRVGVLAGLALAERALDAARLVLEPLTEGHAGEVFPDLREPTLYTFIPRDPPATLAEVAARFRRLAARTSPDGAQVWLNWAARLRASGELAGLVEVTLEGATAHLAYFVFARLQGRGLAREACARVLEALFHEWGVTRVVAEVDTRNSASLRLVESLGLTRAGLRRGVDVFKGAASDEYTYELVAAPESA